MRTALLTLHYLISSLALGICVVAMNNSIIEGGLVEPAASTMPYVAVIMGIASLVSAWMALCTIINGVRSTSQG